MIIMFEFSLTDLMVFLGFRGKKVGKQKVWKCKFSFVKERIGKENGKESSWVVYWWIECKICDIWSQSHLNGSSCVVFSLEIEENWVSLLFWLLPNWRKKEENEKARSVGHIFLSFLVKYGILCISFLWILSIEVTTWVVWCFYRG